jgi:elongation factor Ts
MAITASMVKELRERTGAGMMECKKALVETDGDMESAIEFLRKSGLAQADKKSARIAAEGKIVLAGNDDQTSVVMVEVNCETDFVAMDENFNAFANSVANNALAMNGTEVSELMETGAGDSTLEHARQVLVAKIGENVQVRRIVRSSTNGLLGSYVHGGRIGVTVDLSGGDLELARDLAMHVAALNPEFVSVDDVPADVLQREKDFLISQAAESGKPPEIIEKMVEGRLRKHLSGITLLGQPFVKDGDITVAQLLEQKEATINGFNRLEVGEGIEKKVDNFAEEVMQQVSGS